jgi:hypothetical protein
MHTTLKPDSPEFLQAMGGLLSKAMETPEGMRAIAAAIAAPIEQEIAIKEIGSLMLTKHLLPVGERALYQKRPTGERSLCRKAGTLNPCGTPLFPQLYRGDGGIRNLPHNSNRTQSTLQTFPPRVICSRRVPTPHQDWSQPGDTIRCIPRYER